MLAYFLASHAEHVEQVLKTVELEHVTLSDIAGLDGGVERQGRIERDVGLGDLQLQVVDEVCESRVAEETFPRVDGMFEATDFAVYISLYLVYLCLEVVHHLLVYLLVKHADYFALDVLLGQMPVLECQFNLCLGNVLSIARRVNQKDILALFVLDPLVVNLMVVAEEDDVEAGHLAGY